MLAALVNDNDDEYHLCCITVTAKSAAGLFSSEFSYLISLISHYVLFTGF